jgi:hypothetical protein
MLKETINSFWKAIRIAYEEKKRAGFYPAHKGEECQNRELLLDDAADNRRGRGYRGFNPDRGVNPFRAKIRQCIGGYR